MVKVYFTYTYQQTIGQATSKNCNFICNAKAGCNQYLFNIPIKTGQSHNAMNLSLSQNKSTPIRVITQSQQNVFVGFQDGSIQVWDKQTKQRLHIFDLHKSCVSGLYVCQDQRLVSCGYDGNIIIWDLLSQQSQVIKSAHPSMITQIAVTTIMFKGKPTKVIISVGKDGFLRVWDMKNGICICALTCQVTQVYSMYVDLQRNIVYVGTNKQDIVIVQFNQGKDQQQTKICWIRGIIKKKSVTRTNQIIVQNNIMYVFNGDNTIQTYKMLSEKQIQARKKRLQSRRNKKADKQQINTPVNQQADLQLKFIEQKVVPFKFYNAQVNNQQIYLNNGQNIFLLNQDTQISSSSGRTQQISLQYPFIAQRSPKAISIYSSSTISKLFTIEVNAKYCNLFNGFLIIVAKQNVQIWDLSKNIMVYQLNQQFSGCQLKKNKCLLWRDNQLCTYSVGYDKNKNIKMKLNNSRKFQDKIIQAGYKNAMDKYIVNLQNSQLYINYQDTHKTFLKLYGHKMPVLSFDITSSDAILATGSTDKDIKLWDMDFGHCIKSIFAHQQAVTIVRFVNDTHYLLSGSKDGHVKFWDMDTHQLIMDFQQSTMQIRGLAISKSGDIFISGGLDTGMRIYRQSNDQTIATDMQDKVMQKVMIQDYTKQKLQQNQTKTKYQDLKHGQQIIQAIQNKQSPAVLMNLIKKIPPSNLSACLSFLHQRHVKILEGYLKIMIDGGYEQQTCWRIIKQMNRGTQLGVQMRNVWKPVGKMVGLNIQILKTLLNRIKQQNQMII